LKHTIVPRDLIPRQLKAATLNPSCSQNMKMGRNHRERCFEGMALRELGDIGAAGEERYRHALAIAEEPGLRPLQAH
jgi:hypothetical protein